MSQYKPGQENSFEEKLYSKPRILDNCSVFCPHPTHPPNIPLVIEQQLVLFSNMLIYLQMVSLPLEFWLFIICFYPMGYFILREEGDTQNFSNPTKGNLFQNNKQNVQIKNNKNY